MRHVLKAAGLLAALLVVGPVSTLAFGEKCYPSLTVTGSEEDTQRAAMWAAIDKWEAAAGRKYGGNFDNWHYSGDRTIDCKWNADATCFTCKAKALPCGHRH